MRPLRDKENTAPIVKSILGDLVAFSSSLPGCPSFHPDQDLGFRMSDSNKEDSFASLSVVLLVEAAPPKVNPEEEIAPPVAGLSPAGGAGEEEDPALPGRAVPQESQAALSSSLWTSQASHFH